jgi:hypothetical protein
VLFSLVLLVLGIVAAPATASGPSQYVVEICDPAFPGGNTPGVSFSGDLNYVSPSNTCGQQGSGSLGIYAYKDLSKDTGKESTWTVPISAPQGGSIEALSVLAGSCGGQGIQNMVLEPGWPPNCLGESRKTVRFGSGVGSTEVPIVLRCNLGFCPAGASVWARNIAATMADPVAPQLSALSGSLVDGDLARGHQSVNAESTDIGGGISEVRLLVNGQPTGSPVRPHCETAQATNASIVGTVAASASPCPHSAKASWTVDTAAYPFTQGSNTVQVCAMDFSTVSTPNSGCSSSVPVDVNNSCSESPVDGGQTLNARFTRSNDEEIVVPYDHAANVAGALDDAGGEAVRGATICVQMQLLGARKPTVPVAVATTDANGHFTYKVKAGPNRKVVFGYRHDSFQLSRLLRYRAHAKPTIRLSASELKAGGTLHITGKVPGPGAAARSVVLRAGALHSNRWYYAGEATTNKHGEYRFDYPFDDTTATTTYQFRTEVTKQHEYSWAPGHSVPATVTVRVG